MAEANIEALTNLEPETVENRGVVAALTQANARLANQLEDNSNELRELKAQLNQDRSSKRGQRSFNPSPTNYCWNHGFKLRRTHTSLTCKTQTPGHKKEATRADNMRGSQANKE
jgi:predicted component of type VI protein secretion system